MGDKMSWLQQSTSLIRYHVRKKKFKYSSKKCRQIAVHFYALSHNLKPGFIWDFGTIDQDLLEGVIESHLTHELLLKPFIVFLIHSDFIVLSHNFYNRIISYSIQFVDCSNHNQEPVVTTIPNYPKYIKWLKEIQIKDSFSGVKLNEEINVPTVFGILIGFPIVYWCNYNKDKDLQHCLNNIPLRLVECSIDDCCMYSFTCPENCLMKSKDLSAALKDWIAEKENAGCTINVRYNLVNDNIIL